MDAILLNVARDLRTQADRIDAAFAERIASYDDVRQKLENELRAVSLIIIEELLSYNIIPFHLDS